MTEDAPSLAEIEAYARRHGLADLEPEQMQRLRTMAGAIARAGKEVPRVASKFDQPANVFSVSRPLRSGG
ncbi:MAG: hypothetical protein K2X62_09270 [Beijerinckiaceae bacterium]|jgi:hypothetical protein|nr:hypothetical protein [Beijerinckiaceae bacterium]